MKKILLTIILALSFSSFSQKLTFEPGHFLNSEEENLLIIKKEYDLYKRAYKPEIDGDFKIDTIEMTPYSTKAVINFYGNSYLGKYYIYPDTEQTIYLYKIKGIGNFSLTLTREGSKIRYLYMIPNKGLFTKEALREIPQEDNIILKEHNFSEIEIENIKNSEKFTIFYTGYVTFN